MFVQRVALPTVRVDSWTVLGDDDIPVEPIERYLAYLTDVDRSPNTVRAYAYDLKDYWTFLAYRGLDWREVRLEDLGEYVVWLQLPPSGRKGQIAVLPSVQPHVSASTVNRKLSALSAFYAHQLRHGVDVGDLLTTLQPPGRRGGWKPFLHHISPGRPQPRRTISLKVPKKLPRVLTAAEMQAILDACDHLRDRFLFALLHETGMRIGEALGLRHADIAAAEREVTVVPRNNANRARSKSREQRSIPVSAELLRLWSDYLHAEYGDLDSDYVFVNLFAEPRGLRACWRSSCPRSAPSSDKTTWPSTPGTRSSAARPALLRGATDRPAATACAGDTRCAGPTRAGPTWKTTAEFLPQHREQRQQTLQIISAAEAHGQQRLVEMNRQVADNLEKIITTLEDDGQPGTGEADADAS